MPEEQNHHQIKGILKKTTHKNKVNHEFKWNEKNVEETYHPANKDYGHMKIDEPSTPYSGLNEQDHEVDGVDSDLLNQRMNELIDSNALENQSNDKTNNKEFEQHRKMHYDEAKNIKLARKLIDDEKE